MAFHLEHSLLPGGFLGVDVFFVISGYLITSILVAEGAAGQIAILGFFQRRIARILPLSLLVILAVLGAAYPFFTAVDMSTAGAAAASAALSVANIKFMVQGDYFQVLPDAQPLLHYWSLSVEEQFYLVLPFVLAGSLGRARSRPRLVIALTSLLAMSLLACVVLTPINRTYAFYLLPTRAWELLSGGLLAVVRPPSEGGAGGQRRGVFEALGSLGACLLLTCFVLISDESGFPGYIALVPAFATLLVVLSCECDTWLRRLLCRRELQAIGRVSYSLYLWHWPVYCIIDYALRDHGWPVRTSLKAVLTIVLSIASYSLVERPTRRWLGDPARRRLAFVLAICSIAAVAAVGILVRRSVFVTAPLNDLPVGGTVFNAGTEKLKVALIGDSKAGVFSESLIELSSELGFQLNILAFSAINPIPPGDMFSQIKQQVERIRPDIAIMSAGWSTHDISVPLEEVGPRIVSELAEASRALIFIGEPPLLPETDFRSLIRASGRSTVREQGTDLLRRRRANDALASCRSPRVWYLDPDAFVMNPEGLILLEDDDERLIFQDRIHLSMVGAARFKAALRDLLVEAGMTLTPLP